MTPSAGWTSTKETAPAPAPGGWTSTGGAPPAPPGRGIGASFWEWTGQPVVELFKGLSGKPEDLERSKQIAQTLAQTYANEPGRVWDELAGMGAAMIGANPSEFFYHLALATPLYGAGVKQITDEVAEGKYRQAAGHYLALLVPGLLQRQNLGAMRDVAAASPTAIGGGISGGVKGGLAPTELRVGKFGGVTIPNMPASFSGAVTGSLGGAQLAGKTGAAVGGVGGALLPILKGGYTGAKEALARRSAVQSQIRMAAQARADAVRAAAEEASRLAGLPPQGPAVPYPGPRLLRGLPQGPRILTTPPPETRLLPGPDDTSFVRSVPGEYPPVLPERLRGTAAGETAEALERSLREGGEPATGGTTPKKTAADFASEARAAKAEPMAQLVHEMGFGVEDAKLFDANDWAGIAGASTPPQYPPSAATIPEILARIEFLERKARQK